jgi:hypothetical protein
MKCLYSYLTRADTGENFFLMDMSAVMLNSLKNGVRNSAVQEMKVENCLLQFFEVVVLGGGGGAKRLIYWY